MTTDAFESLRLWLLVILSLLRIMLTPQYLQAYLNIAHTRVYELRKEAGRITNKDLQKKVRDFMLFTTISQRFYRVDFRLFWS